MVIKTKNKRTISTAISEITVKGSDQHRHEGIFSKRNVQGWVLRKTIEISLKLFIVVDREYRELARSVSLLRWFSDAYTAMLKDSRIRP